MFEYVDVYIFAFNFAPPETSDPWLFLSHRTSINSVIEIVARELEAANVKVFVSHNISAAGKWRNSSIFPEDATIVTV